MALVRRVVETENTSSVEYENLEAGEHEGRLVYVADLGLQHREYMGEVKPPAQQISLGIEIVGKSITVDGQEQPRLLWTQPFNIFSTMNERGKELPYYKAFDPSAEEGQIADWDSVLGMPCNVYIKHINGKGEYANRKFDNIESLSPIPSKYQKDVEANRIEPAIGDAEDPNNPATQALYGLALYVYNKRLGNDYQYNPDSNVEIKEAKADFEDDIPF